MKIKELEKGTKLKGLLVKEGRIKAIFSVKEGKVGVWIKSNRTGKVRPYWFETHEFINKEILEDKNV